MKSSTPNPRWPIPDSPESVKPLTRDEIHIRLKADMLAAGHQVTDADVAAVLDRLYVLAELIVRDHHAS
jgi:hypothetical protein